MYVYIYNIILTSVYNCRSVQLRNINRHEQWGRGRVHTKCFFSYLIFIYHLLVRSKTTCELVELITKRAVTAFLYFITSPCCF